MELDKAFQFAVILAWEDLLKGVEPHSVRVEYLCEPGTSLDHLSVWSDRAGGYQDLVCDYWTRASSAHPSGVGFSNRFHSEELAQTIDLIMKNQGQFTRPGDACPHGLVLIYPPDEEHRTEAATWMRGFHGAATNFADAADERGPLSRISGPGDFSARRAGTEEGFAEKERPSRSSNARETDSRVL